MDPRREGLMTAKFIRRSRLRWVNQLMLPDKREWNEELIRQIFYSFDADEICKINIPKTDATDCVAWHFEKNGLFLVHSAYRLAASRWSKGNPAASSSSRDSNDRSIWDLIWKTKVPKKIQIFGWRVATKTLATKTEQMQKNHCPG